jgi:tryptophan halogenase
MIESICVLGGGTAGFMTAAVLSKLNFKVKCIYSSKIGIIGVGESTQTAINEIFKFLEIKDEEWMPKCNATYKSNIGFESWSEEGNQFFYPFEPIKQEKSAVNGFFELCALFPDEINHNQFARFVSPSSRLAELNRLTKNGWNFDGNTAYHFDTHLLSKVLYDVGLKNGVEFIDDTYIESTHNNKGIEKIICEETGDHHADLFIDCTGFKSLLLGEEMKVPFEKYETMLNNRVVSCKVPYSNKEEQLKHYTNNVTMKNGWCWEIPLWDGMSLGYVHTLQFASEEEIEQEFKEFVSSRYGVTPEIKTMKFNSGRREEAWVKNVASVGLSFGFIEPLEATGLFSVITNIFRLLEILTKSSRINAFDRKMFNHTVTLELDKQKTFVDMHYLAAHRCDTEYWDYVTNEVSHDWTKNNLNLSIEMSMFTRDYSDPHYGGLAYILAGNGYSPVSPGFIEGVKQSYDMVAVQAYKDRILQHDREQNNLFETFPTTYEFLKETIYK